jgi:putative Holliday junction resolvase
VSALLGLDVGTRRIGVAIAPAGGGVRPLLTLSRSTAIREQAALRTLVVEQGVTELVIGLPLDPRGGETVQAAAIRAWADEVAAPLGLPIAWRDERHTSQAAEGRIGGAPRGRSGGAPSGSARNAHRARIDREAAAGILQAELDARGSLSPIGIDP